jgi:Helix-loop-helix DNA-binding domain
MSAINSDVYSAACNPPRQVKRPRTGQPQPRAPVNNSSRLILPRRTAPLKESLAETDEPDEDIDDSDYEEPLAAPPTTTPAVKRRGRKPGTISRSTRESLRKQNHSRIEKARRTKINDALDTLRILVPDEYRTKSKDEAEAGDLIPDKKVGRRGDKEQPKEFKLEVLVRTVAYMKDLITKVQDLEAANAVMRSPGGFSRAGLKRKRELVDECEDGRSLEEIKDMPPTNSQTQDTDIDHQLVSPVSSGPKSPRLPSISSWLPQSFVDPTFLPSSHSSQLPSPPLSVTFRPRSDSTSKPPSAAFPVLSLPSPITTLASAVPSPSRDVSRQRVSHSPEDESAASMLLRMKTSPASKGNYIQTPASVLGLEMGHRAIVGS